MTSKCTGPRYENEFFDLSTIDGWHGKFGHLNVLKLDHDSIETGYGAHDRVVVFQPDYEGLYVRIDHLWELGTPTDKQILKVARGFPNDVKGRWIRKNSSTYNNGMTTDILYERVKP